MDLHVQTANRDHMFLGCVTNMDDKDHEYTIPLRYVDIDHVAP